MPASSGRTPSAHDVLREYRVVSALGTCEVPVARAVTAGGDGSPLGVPFAIFEFVDGITVQSRERFDSLSDAQREQVTECLVATLACLHDTSPAAVGLDSLARPGGYGARQVRRWSSQWVIVGSPAMNALAGDVAARLAAMAPERDAGAIVHGDYRIDNTILGIEDGIAIRAVVDWELAAIGDPVADVAMLCAYRSASFDHIVGGPTAWTSPLLPDPTDLVSAYEKAAGTALADWTFHLALAYYKVAVIAAGIDHRHRAAGHDERHSASLAVEPYLTLAHSTLTSPV